MVSYVDMLSRAKRRENIVSLHIYERWKGGYRSLFYWQIFVDGHHFMSSKSGYWSPKIARSEGCLKLLDLDGWFTTWRLSS